MTTMPDPPLRLDPERHGAAPGDEPEYWLTDLRTDLAADPPGWIDTDPPGPHQTSHEPDQAPSPKPLPLAQPETSTPAARTSRTTSKPGLIPDRPGVVPF